MSPLAKNLLQLFTSLWARPALTLKRANLLEMEVSGELVEYKPRMGMVERYLTRPPVRFSDLLFALKEAEQDSRIKALLLKIGEHTLGWARAQELREAIISFRANGKKAFAYLEEASTLDYFLSSACDQIILPPSQTLDLLGLLDEVLYFKGTLDKLEIKPEFFQAGKYKSAVEPYTRESMSREHREALESILESLYQELVGAISSARHLNPEQVKKLTDQAPFLAEEAREKGLVDQVLYLDQLEEMLEELLAEPIRKISAERYYQLRLLSRIGLEGFRKRAEIALVYGTGVIQSGGDGLGLEQWDQTLTCEQMLKTLRAIREDQKIKAVIFRIDSPGGSGLASDLLWRELRLIRENKPLIVSMADVAASGGYYLAMEGEPILAQPTTLTGSIGVIAGKVNLRGLYQKVGMKKELVKRGANADLFSDYSSLQGSKLGKLKRELDYFYQKFVEKVSQARRMKKSEVEKGAQGRVWTGRQAKELGLVDEFGGLCRAIELAKAKIGLSPGERVNISIYPRVRKRFFPALRIKIPFLNLGKEWQWIKILEKLSKERVLYLMPFNFRIR